MSLAACESSVDRQRAAICRQVLPALAPADATIRILRVSEVASAATIQIDYALSGQPNRQFRAACRFGPGAELAGITTERGPITGASLYLLKRYYLNTPDAAAADPASHGR